jgi:hypothetical protein
MRVYDTKQAIYANLRSLPWLPYLGVMHTLCKLLQVQYQDRLAPSEVVLMDQTLQIISTTVQSGDPAREVDPARQLAAQWAALIDDDETSALPGQWNTWCTFEALAAEISGAAKRYAGTERLMLAATQRWREPYPGRARRIDREEEVPDTSELAQTLATFDQVVNAARALLP